jgi:hypothetical protein
VSGFDHSPLDRQQENWHEHRFPYKLASYRKRLLTKPMAVSTLDYTRVASDIEESVREARFVCDGRCDAVAIWVDYDLTPATFTRNTCSDTINNSTISDDCGTKSAERMNEKVSPSASASACASGRLEQWDGVDFPCHLKLNLKFFPEPIDVKLSPENSDSKKSALSCTSSFEVGDSDFKLHFAVL